MERNLWGYSWGSQTSWAHWNPSCGSGYPPKFQFPPQNNENPKISEFWKFDNFVHTWSYTMFLGTTSTYSSRSVDSRGFFCFSMMVGFPYLIWIYFWQNLIIFRKNVFGFFSKSDPRGYKNSKVSKKNSEMNVSELDLIFAKKTKKKFKNKKVRFFPRKSKKNRIFLGFCLHWAGVL